MSKRTGLPHERRWLFRVVAASMVAAAAETMSCAASRFLEERRYMYAPPNGAGDPRAYRAYLEARHPILGWPYPDDRETDVGDGTEARHSPAFPDADQPSRISLYGDSFTESECSDAEAWGNQLALRLGMPVANYGVGGYGSDQALLRFEGNRDDPSDVVILGHVSENILRNLTRNRDLLTHHLDHAYKPRFVLDAHGQLQYVPLPCLTRSEHLRLLGVRGPRFVLAHESFEPNGATGIVTPRFPYTWSIVRCLGTFRMRARLADRPEWAEFYQRDHPLRGLEITVAICKRFAGVAKERGKVPIILVLPGEPDLRHYRRSGRHVYDALVADLRREGVVCLEFGTAMAEGLGSREPRELFNETAHYLPEADARLAAFVHRNLRERGLPP